MTGPIDVPDGEYSAVLDAVEDGLATVFLEVDGDEAGSAVLDASVLPADARHADAVLSVTVSGGHIDDAEYEAGRTESRRKAAQDRFDHLSERPPSDDDN